VGSAVGSDVGALVDGAVVGNSVKTLVGEGVGISSLIAMKTFARFGS
jgi:hypothetical protein